MDKEFKTAFYEKIKQKRCRVTISILFSMTRSVLVLIPTLLMRTIYNSLEFGLDPAGVIGNIMLTFILPVIVGASYSLDISMSKYIFVIIKELRVQALLSVLKYKLRKILTLDQGDLFNRIIVSLEELGDYYYYFINTTTWYVTTSIVGIIIMLVINYRITLVLLVFSLLQIGCSFVIQNRIEKVKALENQLQAQGTDYIMRVTRHNVFMKTALQDEHEIEQEKKWEQDAWRTYRLKIINNQIVGGISFGLTLLRTLYLFFAAHYLFLNYGMTKGDFIALNSYIIWLTPVFEGLQECIKDIIISRENKRRVNEYLKEEAKEEGQSLIPDTAANQIEVTNVSFVYDDAENQLFSDLSFEIKQGETLFIVGASGSGKSTLLNLMLGLESVYDGEIYYNGLELRKIDDTWLHHNVIMVGQEAVILPTSLRENMLYSGVQATDQEVIKVLNLLKLGYLLDMPGGLDWDMKKHPRVLSDGEKRRIAIGRALLGNPKVLFLDEPTADLDNVNKLAVIQFIEERINGILVIVTHDHVFTDDARVFYMPDRSVSVLNE